MLILICFKDHRYSEGRYQTLEGRVERLSDKVAEVVPMVGSTLEEVTKVSSNASAVIVDLIKKVYVLYSFETLLSN